MAALGDLHCGFFIGLGQQEYEFLAAKTGNQIARTNYRQVQGLRHVSQALIALNVAIVIVILFEEIDIEQDQRQWLAAAVATGPFDIEARIKLEISIEIALDFLPALRR
jgi:hypothetical protein